MATSAQMVTAARIRALLLSAVDNLQVPANATAILRPLAEQLKAAGTNEAAAVKRLETLAKADQITRIKDGKAVLYCKNGMAEPKPMTWKLATEEAAPTSKRKFSALVRSMTIADAEEIYHQLHKLFGKG